MPGTDKTLPCSLFPLFRLFTDVCLRSWCVAVADAARCDSCGCGAVLGGLFITAALSGDLLTVH